MRVQKTVVAVTGMSILAAGCTYGARQESGPLAEPLPEVTELTVAGQAEQCASVATLVGHITLTGARRDLMNKEHHEAMRDILTTDTRTETVVAPNFLRLVVNPTDTLAADIPALQNMVQVAQNDILQIPQLAASALLHKTDKIEVGSIRVESGVCATRPSWRGPVECKLIGGIKLSGKDRERIQEDDLIIREKIHTSLTAGGAKRPDVLRVFTGKGDYEQALPQMPELLQAIKNNSLEIISGMRGQSVLYGTNNHDPGIIEVESADCQGDGMVPYNLPWTED